MARTHGNQATPPLGSRGAEKGSTMDKIVNNVMAVVKGKRGAIQRPEAFATPDGVLLDCPSDGQIKRYVVPTGTVVLCNALIDGGCAPVVIGHGIRWIRDGASPLFLPRTGAADVAGPTVYLFGRGGEQSRPTLDALATAGVRVREHKSEGGNKPGLYLSLFADVTADECAALLSFAATHATKGKGDGWQDGAAGGFGTRLDPVTLAPPVKVEGGTGDKPEGKVDRRHNNPGRPPKGSKGKGKTAADKVTDAPQVDPAA